jgi:hypothetical protein
MSGDLHRPTTAGPTPEPAAVASGPSRPALPAGGGDGDALPFGIPPEHPEYLVGAAFAGGLLTALILKRFGGNT